jgi:hypothetical protein
MRYAWIIILLSAILGLLAALLLTISPTIVLFEPEFRAGNVPGALRAWGVTWLFFNVLALVVLFRGFRQGERWAWWTRGNCLCCGSLTSWSTRRPSTTSQ